MKYRYKEECKLCGKIVYLLPHIKNKHKSTKKEYDKVKSELAPSALTVPSTSASQYGLKFVGREKPSGLYKLSKKITKSAKQKRSIQKSIHQDSQYSNVGPNIKSNRPEICVQNAIIVDDTATPSSDLLKYYVHQLDLYKMQILNLKIRQAIENGDSLETLCTNLQSNKLLNFSRFMDLQQLVCLWKHLMRYFCYPAYIYPYPRFRWPELCLDGKLIGPYPKEFYLHCCTPCIDAFDCTKCKRWGKGNHVCWDFYFCSVCDVKANVLKMERKYN